MHIGVCQLRLGLPDSLGHLREKLIPPVRQQNAQLHRGESLIQLLLIGCSGRNVSRIPDRIQHPLPHIRPHMGTVVQHPVHCPPGDPRQICHHLNCRSLSHKLLRPLAADSASLYTPAQ